jgi:hypothetical protein
LNSVAISTTVIQYGLHFVNKIISPISPNVSPLKLPFVPVFSQILQETLFFAENHGTRAALVEAGAEPWSIYTRAELQTLCVQNRVAPLTAAELRKVHEIKRTVSGRISS